MNPKQISQDDLIMFALQDLTPAEAAEVVVHLEHSETARKELAQIQGDLAAYALTSNMHSPPAQARERLLGAVAKERKAAPVEHLERIERAPVADEPILVSRSARVFQVEETPQRRSGMGFFGWVGWAVAASCAVALGLEHHQHQELQQDYDSQSAKLIQVGDQAAKAQAVMQVLTDAGAMQVSLHLANSTEPPKPEGRAAYVAETGSLVFVGMHLEPLQPYKTYELWVIPADGHDPIPAGLFKPDQRGFASVILPELPKGIVAKTFGVTIEDDGGAKAPTPPIILAGM